jgi:hypothetical protein
LNNRFDNEGRPAPVHIKDCFEEVRCACDPDSITIKLIGDRAHISPYIWKIDTQAPNYLLLEYHYMRAQQPYLIAEAINLLLI